MKTCLLGMKRPQINSLKNERQSNVYQKYFLGQYEKQTRKTSLCPVGEINNILEMLSASIFIRGFRIQVDNTNSLLFSLQEICTCV